MTTQETLKQLSPSFLESWTECFRIPRKLPLNVYCVSVVIPYLPLAHTATVHFSWNDKNTLKNASLRFPRNTEILGNIKEIFQSYYYYYAYSDMSIMFKYFRLVWVKETFFQFTVDLIFNFVHDLQSSSFQDIITSVYNYSLFAFIRPD